MSNFGKTVEEFKREWERADMLGKEGHRTEEAMQEALWLAVAPLFELATEAIRGGLTAGWTDSRLELADPFYIDMGQRILKVLDEMFDKRPAPLERAMRDGGMP